MPVATWNPLSELRTLIVALAIAGLATVHGGSAFAQTVPEIAPGAVMFVVMVAESLAGFGSGVSAVTAAVFVTTEPAAAVTLTASVKTTLEPLASVPSMQSIVPVPLTAGMVHPALGLRLWKVVPAGIASVSLTPTAGSGPAL